MTFPGEILYQKSNEVTEYESNGTLLVTQPYSSFTEGRVVEGTLPLFKKEKLSKILFYTAIGTTQPELKKDG